MRVLVRVHAFSRGVLDTNLPAIYGGFSLHMTEQRADHYLKFLFWPVMQYWWEPNTPISVAFWSICGICVILVILAIFICCLWRGAKR